MYIRVQHGFLRLTYLLFISGFLLTLSGCSTTREGDYYVRNHHNDNMTKVSVNEGEIIEKEITYQQYLEETEK